MKVTWNCLHCCGMYLQNHLYASSSTYLILINLQFFYGFEFCSFMSGNLSKGGLILESFFTSKKNVLNHCPSLFTHLSQDTTKLKIHSENKPTFRKIEDMLRILVSFNVSCMIDAWFDKVAPINECMHRCFRFGVNYSDFWPFYFYFVIPPFLGRK